MLKKFSKSLVVASLLAVLSLNVSGASAASQITVDLPNTAVPGGETVSVPIEISGFTYSVLNVTIIAESGTLTVQDDGSLLTLNPGYPSLNSQAEISFHAAAADVASALQNDVSWTSPGDPTSTTELKLKLQIAEFKEGTSYDSLTGHSYVFITDAKSWPDAQAAAKLMTVNGKTGYLTNISSTEENEFVKNKSGAISVWFGATMDKDIVNAALNAVGKPTLSSDPQLTGDMYWVNGPEAGTHFSSGLETATVVDGLFNSWSDGEPNNWGGGEGCGVTNWNGFNGKWNDLPCDEEHSFLVEFDTELSDFESIFTTWDNITGTDSDAFPGDGSTEEEVKTLADTGYNPLLIFGFAALLLAAGVYFSREARRH